jgi:hypothetical protein
VTCVRVGTLISCLVCVAHPSLTPCFFVNIKVEIPRKRDIVNKAKHRGIQVGLWTA